MIQRHVDDAGLDRVAHLERRDRLGPAEEVDLQHTLAFGVELLDPGLQPLHVDAVLGEGADQAQRRFLRGRAQAATTKQSAGPPLPGRGLCDRRVLGPGSRGPRGAGTGDGPGGTRDEASSLQPGERLVGMERSPVRALDAMIVFGPTFVNAACRHRAFRGPRAPAPATPAPSAHRPGTDAPPAAMQR